MKRLAMVLLFAATATAHADPESPKALQPSPAPDQPAPSFVDEPSPAPLASPAPAAEPSPAPIAAPSPPPAAGALDFDLFGERKPARPDPAKLARDRDIESRTHRRRLMLKLHQGFGFATLGVMAVTLVIGQLNYQDKYAGPDDGRYYNAHLGLSIGTTAIFATTGLLALFAPNPYKKPVRADTALAHKILMGLSTAGMVAESILGPIAAAREGKLDQKQWALAHEVTGYATFGLLVAGVVTYVF